MFSAFFLHTKISLREEHFWGYSNRHLNINLLCDNSFHKYLIINETTCILFYYQLFLIIRIIVYFKKCLSDGSYRGTKLIDLKAISDEAVGKCKDQWVLINRVNHSAGDIQQDKLYISQQKNIFWRFCSHGLNYGCILLRFNLSESWLRFFMPNLFDNSVTCTCKSVLKHVKIL